MSSESRTPPHSIEAERALLGAAMLSADALEHALTLGPDAYYHPDHRAVAGALAALAATGRPIDAVTVAEEVRRAGHTLREQPHAYIADTPSISNAAGYATIVRESHTLRGLLYAAADISEAAYTAQTPTEAWASVDGALDALRALASDDESALDVADIAGLIAGRLEPEEADLLTRTDSRALLYSGKLNTFQAEPESGKSWLALAAVREVLEQGGAAIYIDYEDTPAGLLGRLLALGADPAHLTERLRILQIHGPYGAAERSRLQSLIDEINPDLVVIDSVVEALTAQGSSEDSAAEYVEWTNALPRPLARQGIAVLLLDHVAKDTETRGRWARGTGQKLGVIDGAAYNLRVSTPFDRNHTGRIRVVIAKDRPAGVGRRGDTAAIATITPSAAGAHVALDLEPDTSHLRTADTWKPTHLMARVAQLIEEAQQPLTPRAVKDLLPQSKPTLVAQAIARLEAEGYVKTSGGRTKHLQLLRGYTDPEADEPEPHPEHTHALDRKYVATSEPPPLPPWQTDDQAPPAEMW